MNPTPKKRPGWIGRFTTLLLVAALCATTAVSASDLASAKADGWIGEKPDGYIGLVRSDAPADVQTLMREVNAKRRTEYQRIADRQGAPLAEVEKVGGMTAIEKTRPGHYVMDATGRWRRK